MARKGSDLTLWIATIAAITALAALAIIIANIGYFDLGDGGPSIIPLVNDIATMVIYAIITIWFIIAIVLFMGRSKSGGKVKVGQRRGTNWVLVLLIVFGILLLFVWQTNGQLIPQKDGGGGSGQNGDGGDPTDALKSTATTAALLGVLLALGLAGGMIGLMFIRRRPIRYSAAIRMKESGQRAAANRILEEAIQNLYAGEDARSVIVRTYQQMCRLMRRDRLDYAAPPPPREFAEIAERKFSWPKGPVDDLTVLFEEAWYSSHELDEAKKEKAIVCLKQIKGALGPGAGERGGGASAAA